MLSSLIHWIRFDDSELGAPSLPGCPPCSELGRPMMLLNVLTELSNSQTELRDKCKPHFEWAVAAILRHVSHLEGHLISLSFECSHSCMWRNKAEIVSSDYISFVDCFDRYDCLLWGSMLWCRGTCQLVCIINTPENSLFLCVALQSDGYWVREHVSPDGTTLPGCRGRQVTPGHALEAGWFLLQEAAAR